MNNRFPLELRQKSNVFQANLNQNRTNYPIFKSLFNKRLPFNAKRLLTKNKTKHFAGTKHFAALPAASIGNSVSGY